MRRDVFIAVALLTASATGTERVLTFDEAIGLVDRSPEVEGAKRASRSHRDLAGRISRFTGNPQIVLQPGYRWDPEDKRGIEGNVGVLLPWNLGGLSTRRREAAEAEGDWLEAVSRLKALEHRQEAARSWIQLAAAEQMAEITRAEAVLAEELVAQVQRRLALEEATALELAGALAYASEARLAAIEAAGTRARWALQLSRETSDTPTADLATAGPLPAPPVPTMTPEKILATVDALPPVRAPALLARAEMRWAAETRAAARSEVLFGVLAQKEAPDEYSGYLAITYSPAWLDRGERERAWTEANAARAEGDAQQAIRSMRALLAETLQQVEQTAQLAEEFENGLVPSMEETARLASRLVESGEQTVTELLRARRDAAMARRRHVGIVAEHLWARVRLWLFLASIEEERRRAS